MTALGEALGEGLWGQPRGMARLMGALHAKYDAMRDKLFEEVSLVVRPAATHVSELNMLC